MEVCTSDATPKLINHYHQVKTYFGISLITLETILICPPKIAGLAVVPAKFIVQLNISNETEFEIWICSTCCCYLSFRAKYSIKNICLLNNSERRKSFKNKEERERDKLHP
jgi:hypothetical protein